MNADRRTKGSVILIAVFAIALLSTLVIGILQMNTEEIQLMQNHIHAAQAQAVAEAGLNDAFSQLRLDNQWRTGFTNKSFAGGSYNVAVTGTLPQLLVSSTGTNNAGMVSRVRADITISGSSPYIIRIDQMRINQ